MIDKILFGNQGWNQAKGALDAAAERQRAIASNIANVATPGYRAKEVAFEEFLEAEKTGGGLSRTQPGHLAGSAGGARATPKPELRARADAGAGSGINNVSIERETTELAENSLHFQALSQFLANKYRAIRDAIRTA